MVTGGEHWMTLEGGLWNEIILKVINEISLFFWGGKDNPDTWLFSPVPVPQNMTHIGMKRC